MRIVGLSLEHLSVALAACACLAAYSAEPTPASTPRTVAVPVRNQNFDILEIAVDGNTRLNEIEIQLAMEPFVGEGRKASDVDAARTALEQLYKQRGYKSVAVTIPKQTIKDGLVVLEVVEGKVGSLEVLGSRYTSIDQIKLEVPSLTEGTVPNFAEVEKELNYANRLANRRVTPVLALSATPGTIDVDLNVDDQLPLRLTTEVNNRHGRDTSFMRAVVTAGYDNLFQLGHSVTLSVQIAPYRLDDGRVYYGSYRIPFADGSWSVTANALRTGSNVSALSGVDVNGSGKSFGLSLSKQWPAIGGIYYPSIAIGVDYKNFNTVASVGPGAEIRTPVEYVPVTLSVTQLLRLEGQSFQNDFRLSVASPAVGSNSATIDLNRFQARGQMLQLRNAMTYERQLPGAIELGLRFSTQITDQPLISSEQFAGGGMDNVRGYLEAEVLGDYGYFASAELRAPSLSDYVPSSLLSRAVTQFQPYAFFDSADLKLRGPFLDNSSPRAKYLSSFGFGLSFKLIDHLSGTLDWAMPVHRGTVTGDGDSRLLFRISASL